MTERFKKHVPNALDRQLLVWYKEFPSKQQIPTAVE